LIYIENIRSIFVIEKLLYNNLDIRYLFFIPDFKARFKPY
jgi:hypothetical protein